MAKKPKSETTTAAKTTTTKRASTPPTQAKDAATEAAYAAAPVSKQATLPAVNTVSTPVTPAPAAVKAAVAPAVTPVAAKTTSTTATVVETPAGTAPVKVLLKKAGQQDVSAVIRYQGKLAKNGSDKLVAVLGVEWFGSPRWQGSQDVELKKSKDGAFEAEVQLASKDARGAELMALQVAFTTPTRQTWDSAGVPYGYYQVSALTGAVETVPN